MGNATDIRTAVIGGVYDIALPYPTKYPNRPVDKDDNEPWLQVDVLYNPPTMIGLKSLDNTTGILQITVNIKQDNDELLAFQIADEVRAIIPKNQAGFDFGNVSVKFSSSGVARPIPDDGWYKLPVTATFQVFTNRFN